MCVKRFMMIYNIQQIPLEDIVVYLKRLVRIYVILVILSVVRLVTGNLELTTEFILNIVGLGLYFLNVLMVKLVSENPTIRYSIFPLVSSITLCIFNIVETIVLVVVDKNYWSLFNLISVFIQLTTIFILHKLREKIHAQDNAMMQNDIETPVIAEAEVVASPMMSNGARPESIKR